MANRGGYRPGAGRKPGSANQKTREIAGRAVKEGITPLEYLLSVVRDGEASRSERMDAAKAAAPYVHPRLSPVSSRPEQSNVYYFVSDREMTPEEWEAEYCKAIGE